MYVYEFSNGQIITSRFVSNIFEPTLRLQDIANLANSKGGNVLITFPPLGFIVKVMLWV